MALQRTSGLNHHELLSRFRRETDGEDHERIDERRFTIPSRGKLACRLVFLAHPTKPEEPGVPRSLVVLLELVVEAIPRLWPSRPKERAFAWRVWKPPTNLWHAPCQSVEKWWSLFRSCSRRAIGDLTTQ